MLHASTQQLIRKLHELTEAGGLAWKEGERETSRLETEGYIVEVEATPPGFRLLRGDGRELEKATADDLAAVAWPGGEGTYASRVAEMAARAHRIARGAEQAIATILSSLSAPAKKPAPPTPAPTPVAPAPTSAAPQVAAVPPSQPKPLPPAEPPRPAEAPKPAPAAVASPPNPASPAPTPAGVTAPFGETPGFAKPAEPTPPAQQPAAPSPTPRKPDLLMQGISARSVQGVEQSSATDLQRLAPAAPKPTPQPNPAPAPPPRPQQPTTGPGVYKPWS